MKNKYDIIIVGMGPSSIFCAYELLKLNTKKKILLIEKGHRIENRICPISKSGKCLKCKPICSIIGGFSGAGAFSDGKLLSYHLSSYNNSDENDIYIDYNKRGTITMEEWNSVTLNTLIKQNGIIGTAKKILSR